MQILIDASIEHADLFAPLGDLQSFPARNLNPAALANAEALIVRSTTRVDESVIAAAPRLHFVGTLTTGTDHIDTAALARRNITLADAAGCNSRAVAEYIIATILHFAATRHFEPTEKTLGIIGLGRIGSLVARIASVLGMPILACDPPLQLRNANNVSLDLLPFEEVQARSDVITVHVPLTASGPHQTRNMINAEAFSMMKPSVMLINTSRGEILDEAAALQFAIRNPDSAIVLDVFHNEPRPDPRVIAAATLATPHIAGQTADARLRAAFMIRDALAGIIRINVSTLPGAYDSISIGGSTSAIRIGSSPGLFMNPTIQQVTRLADMSDEFKLAAKEHIVDLPVAFDHLRQRAAQRREFHSYTLKGLTDSAARSLASALGFKVA